MYFEIIARILVYLQYTTSYAESQDDNKKELTTIRHTMVSTFCD